MTIKLLSQPPRVHVYHPFRKRSCGVTNMHTHTHTPLWSRIKVQCGELMSTSHGCVSATLPYADPSKRRRPAATICNCDWAKVHPNAYVPCVRIRGTPCDDSTPLAWQQKAPRKEKAPRRECAGHGASAFLSPSEENNRRSTVGPAIVQR